MTDHEINIQIYEKVEKGCMHEWEETVCGHVHGYGGLNNEITTVCSGKAYICKKCGNKTCCEDFLQRDPRTCFVVPNYVADNDYCWEQLIKLLERCYVMIHDSPDPYTLEFVVGKEGWDQEHKHFGMMEILSIDKDPNRAVLLAVLNLMGQDDLILEN